MSKEHDDLRALAEKATPGEWQKFHDNEAGDWKDHYIGQKGDGFLDRAVATYLTEEDAAYIVAACNSVPALLDEIERLRAYLTEIRDECYNAGKWSDIVMERMIERIELSAVAALTGGQDHE